MDKVSPKEQVGKVYREMVRTLSPFGGVFELTPRCSLDCKMCFVHLTNEQMKGRKELPTEDWIRIIDEAYDMGLTYALLTGGECIMHPGFRDIVRHMRSKGIIVSVNSNGLLLTDDLLNFLNEQAIRRIQITIYGSNEDSYERVTGHRAFEKVMAAIDRVQAHGIALQIAITPSAYLMDDIVDIIKLCKEKKLAHNINNHLIEADEDTGRSLETYSPDETKLVEIFKEWMRLNNKEIIKIDPCLLTAPERIELDQPRKGFRCSAGRGHFAVTWDGMLHPCLNIRNICSKPLEIGFERAWREINELSRNYIVPAECDGCKYAMQCFPCVLCRADPNDPAHCDPTVCKITMNRIAEGVNKIPFAEDLPY